MTEFEMIILGIATGIITTVIIFVFKSLLYKVIIPWYLKITYKGVDISGKWSATYNGLSLSMEIKQSAHNLNGVLSISKKDGENIDTSSHYVKGNVWEGYVSLQTNTVDTRNLSFGNLLLKVESGKLLKGIYVARMFSNNLDVGIYPNEVEFVRNI